MTSVSMWPVARGPYDGRRRNGAIIAVSMTAAARVPGLDLAGRRQDHDPVGHDIASFGACFGQGQGGHQGDMGGGAHGSTIAHQTGPDNPQACAGLAGRAAW